MTSQLVVPLAFESVVLVPRRVRRELKRLSPLEKRALQAKLDEICKEGPSALLKLDFYQSLRTEEGVKALAAFQLGKLFTVIEVLTRHIRLAAIVQLDRLLWRRSSRDRLLWKRCQHSNYRVNGGAIRRRYKIVSAVLIDKFNTIIWFQKLVMSYSDPSRDPRTKVLTCLSWNPFGYHSESSVRTALSLTS